MSENMEPDKIIIFASLTFFSIIAFIACVIYVVLPCIFKWSTTAQKNAVFLPFLRRDVTNLDKPEIIGVQGCRNFHIDPESGISLGAWHILPDDLVNHKDFVNDKDWFEKSLNFGQPIVIYFHGTNGTRAISYRVGLYKILQKLNYHVICCDYRGFADSTRVTPNKVDVVNDSVKVYEYVKNLANETPIFIYGHSLGTAISVEVLAKLCGEGNKSLPTALILESPFNNIHEAFVAHPLFRIWRKMPFVDWFFTKQLTEDTTGFVSDQKIDKISVPILFMHSKDDTKVPYNLGQKLYQTAIANRSDVANDIDFVSFDAELGLGHRLIYSAPDTPRHIENFVTKSIINNAMLESANSHHEEEA